MLEASAYSQAITDVWVVPVLEKVKSVKIPFRALVGQRDSLLPELISGAIRVADAKV